MHLPQPLEYHCVANSRGWIRSFIGTRSATVRGHEVRNKGVVPLWPLEPVNPIGKGSKRVREIVKEDCASEEKSLKRIDWVVFTSD